MQVTVQTILGHLHTVARERADREASPDLAARVHALKRYQQARFAFTYQDLLSSARYGLAARFFLEELYGPSDFRERDAQFARVVPALVRLFPKEIVETVATLGQLHALSEQLDTRTARQLDGVEIVPAQYAAAWQAAGDEAARETQIDLTLKVGAALDRFTRKPLLRRSLHLMRGPARASGLGQLQVFLESGFDAFKAMRGAQEFLDLIGSRERSLARLLFRYAEADGDILAEHLPH